MDKLLVVGAGGHAKVVIDCAKAQDVYDDIIVVDSDSSKWGQKILGILIDAPDKMFPGEVSHFICAIGSDQSRQKQYNYFLKSGFDPVNICHPTSYISQYAVLGKGLVVMRGVTIHPETSIGDNVIINTQAIIEHDCEIGAHAQICPGAIICGNVTIGESSFIGAGSIIKQGVRVGSDCMIAAGSMVIDDVPSGQRVMGVPARVK